MARQMGMEGRALPPGRCMSLRTIGYANRRIHTIRGVLLIRTELGWFAAVLA
jgi:hypothetical protein